MFSHCCCCCCSVAQHVGFFVTPWTAALQASMSFILFWSLLKSMSIESVMLSHHLILCYPLFLLPSAFSSMRVFSNESALRIRWPKYSNFSFSPSNEYSGFIPFRIEWLEPRDLQESPATPQIEIIDSSAFSLLYVQLSRPYMQKT